jgi:putative transposase
MKPWATPGCDVVHAQNHDGRPLPLVARMHEYSRDCLTIDVARRMTGEHGLERLSNWFIHRGVSHYTPSENGPEFTAIDVPQWLAQVEVKALFIEPISPREDVHIESFNGKF